MKKEVSYEIEYMDPSSKYEFWHVAQRNIQGKIMLNSLSKDFAKRNPNLKIRIKKITTEIYKTFKPSL